MFIWAPCAQLYSLAETPHPPPEFGLIYEGAIGKTKFQTTSHCNPLTKVYTLDARTYLFYRKELKPYMYKIDSCTCNCLVQFLNTIPKVYVGCGYWLCDIDDLSTVLKERVPKLSTLFH